MKLDLNLLLVLDVLLSEGSVTRAAKRLHLAQPTVSNALARLRAHFGDPLLQREGREMRPTARAKQLLVPIREALASVDRALMADKDFAPATAARIFRIAATDYVGAVLLPPLLSRLRREAPGVKLLVTDIVPSNPLRVLENDEADLVLGSISTISPYIHRWDLFSDSWACVARRSHPLMRGRFTATKFRKAAHLEVRPQHGGLGGTIDAIVAQGGAERNIVVTLPHLFVAPYLLLQSDLILTLASRAASKVCAGSPLQLVSHPLPLKPFVISQLWHQRTHATAEYSWFRQLLAEVAGTI